MNAPRLRILVVHNRYRSDQPSGENRVVDQEIELLTRIGHGCYRNSPMATAPRTANMMLSRRRWWSGIARFFCVSDSQRRVLVQAGMPAHLLSVKRNFVVDPGVRRTGAGEHVLFVGRMT